MSGLTKSELKIFDRAIKKYRLSDHRAHVLRFARRAYALVDAGRGEGARVGTTR